MSVGIEEECGMHLKIPSEDSDAYAVLDMFIREQMHHPYGPGDNISVALRYITRFAPLNQGFDMMSEAEMLKFVTEANGFVHYLNCNTNVPIHTLCKFISLKYKLGESHIVQMFKRDHLLPAFFTLKDVAIIFTWKQIKPLELNFCIYKHVNKRDTVKSPQHCRRREKRGQQKPVRSNGDYRSDEEINSWKDDTPMEKNSRNEQPLWQSCSEEASDSDVLVLDLEDPELMVICSDTANKEENICPTPVLESANSSYVSSTKTASVVTNSASFSMDVTVSVNMPCQSIASARSQEVHTYPVLSGDGDEDESASQEDREAVRALMLFAANPLHQTQEPNATATFSPAHSDDSIELGAVRALLTMQQKCLFPGSPATKLQSDSIVQGTSDSEYVALNALLTFQHRIEQEHALWGTPTTHPLGNSSPKSALPSTSQTHAASTYSDSPPSTSDMLALYTPTSADQSKSPMCWLSEFPIEQEPVQSPAETVEVGNPSFTSGLSESCREQVMFELSAEPLNADDYTCTSVPPQPYIKQVQLEPPAEAHETSSPCRFTIISEIPIEQEHQDCLMESSEGDDPLPEPAFTNQELTEYPTGLSEWDKSNLKSELSEPSAESNPEDSLPNGSEAEVDNEQAPYFAANLEPAESWTAEEHTVVSRQAGASCTSSSDSSVSSSIGSCSAGNQCHYPFSNQSASTSLSHGTHLEFVTTYGMENAFENNPDILHRQSDSNPTASGRVTPPTSNCQYTSVWSTTCSTSSCSTGSVDSTADSKQQSTNNLMLMSRDLVRTSPTGMKRTTMFQVCDNQEGSRPPMVNLGILHEHQPTKCTGNLPSLQLLELPQLQAPFGQRNRNGMPPVVIRTCRTEVRKHIGSHPYPGESSKRSRISSPQVDASCAVSTACLAPAAPTVEQTRHQASHLLSGNTEPSPCGMLVLKHTDRSTNLDFSIWSCLDKLPHMAPQQPDPLRSSVSPGHISAAGGTGVSVHMSSVQSESTGYNSSAAHCSRSLQASSDLSDNAGHASPAGHTSSSVQVSLMPLGSDQQVLHLGVHQAEPFITTDSTPLSSNQSAATAQPLPLSTLQDHTAEGMAPKAKWSVGHSDYANFKVQSNNLSVEPAFSHSRGNEKIQADVRPKVTHLQHGSDFTESATTGRQRTSLSRSSGGQDLHSQCSSPSSSHPPTVDTSGPELQFAALKRKRSSPPKPDHYPLQTVEISGPFRSTQLSRPESPPISYSVQPIPAGQVSSPSAAVYGCPVWTSRTENSRLNLSSSSLKTPTASFGQSSFKQKQRKKQNQVSEKKNNFMAGLADHEMQLLRQFNIPKPGSTQSASIFVPSLAPSFLTSNPQPTQGFSSVSSPAQVFTGSVSRTQVFPERVCHPAHGISGNVPLPSQRLSRSVFSLAQGLQAPSPDQNFETSVFQSAQSILGNIPAPTQHFSQNVPHIAKGFSGNIPSPSQSFSGSVSSLANIFPAKVRPPAYSSPECVFPNAPGFHAGVYPFDPGFMSDVSPHFSYLPPYMSYAPGSTQSVGGPPGTFGMLAPAQTGSSRK